MNDSNLMRPIIVAGYNCCANAKKHEKIALLLCHSILIYNCISMDAFNDLYLLTQQLLNGRMK